MDLPSPVAPFRSEVDRVERRLTPSLDGRTRSPLLERRPPTGVLFTAALALRSDHSATTAAPRCRLDCFHFPHDCGEEISSGGRMAGRGCLLSLRRCDPGASLDIREGIAPMLKL